MTSSERELLVTMATVLRNEISGRGGFLGRKAQSDFLRALERVEASGPEPSSNGAPTSEVVMLQQRINDLQDRQMDAGPIDRGRLDRQIDDAKARLELARRQS